jgi:hypothetical protein
LKTAVQKLEKQKENTAALVAWRIYLYIEQKAWVRIPPGFKVFSEKHILKMYVCIVCVPRKRNKVIGPKKYFFKCRIWKALSSITSDFFAETGKWTKLHSMKSMCGFVGGILVDRPIHLEENIS